MVDGAHGMRHMIQRTIVPEEKEIAIIQNQVEMVNIVLAKLLIVIVIVQVVSLLLKVQTFYILNLCS